MTFEILLYRKKYSAVTREAPGGAILWYSKTWDTEAEARAAVQGLAAVDWKSVEVVLAKY
jgi:hypothetical protein